jgi:hypothetical protein
VVEVFGAARLHHAYLFANQRGTRMKVLVHDGQGLWCRRRFKSDHLCRLNFDQGLVLSL